MTALTPEVLLKTQVAVEQARFSRLKTQIAIERSRQSLAETRALIVALKFASEKRKQPEKAKAPSQQCPLAARTLEPLPNVEAQNRPRAEPRRVP
jgi:hypothetical protein